MAAPLPNGLASTVAESLFGNLVPDFLLNCVSAAAVIATCTALPWLLGSRLKNVTIVDGCRGRALRRTTAG